MPGLIDRMAAEHAEEVRQTIRARERDDAKSEANKDRERREGDAPARRIASSAAAGMTGRVIFPARWAIVPVNEHYRRHCRETLEGRVVIDVFLNMGHVERIAVSKPGGEGNVRWEPPQWRDRPVKDRPSHPGRRWFREALAKLGVI